MNCPAQGSDSRSSKATTKSKRCGNCNEKLPPDHAKPFCFRCIYRLEGKESAQAMKECRALQAGMLATLQSFKASVEKRQSGPSSKAPSVRESFPSQDGTSGSRGMNPYAEEEEAEASVQDSCERNRGLRPR